MSATVREHKAEQRLFERVFVTGVLEGQRNSCHIERWKVTLLMMLTKKNRIFLLAGQHHDQKVVAFT